MAEFKLGRIKFVWKDAWQSATTYYVDDVVRNGGTTYICTVGHTSNVDFNVDLEAGTPKWNAMASGLGWEGDWSSSTEYKLDDLVKYGGIIYICIDGHTSAATATLGLEDDSDKWEIFVEGTEWSSDWSTNTRYKLNQIVRYGGITYICNTGHTSAATTVLGLENDQSKWDTFNAGFEYKGEWSQTTKYIINDVVKYGPQLWICIANHESSTGFNSGFFQEFVKGFEYENSWSSVTSYQSGDVVSYGGNQYVAKVTTLNEVPPTTSSSWDLFSRGFSFQSDWSSLTAYKIGEVVRLNGYSYLAIANNTNSEPPSSNWERLTSGFYWRGEWTNSTAYKLGDAVRFNVNTYICVQSHTSADDDSTGTTGDALLSPATDTAGTYWNVLTLGTETSVLTTTGDMIYYGGAGPTRLPIGTQGQVLKVNANGLPQWDHHTFVEDVYYVAPHGVDLPAPISGLTIDAPWASIRYATEQIEKGTKNPNARRLLELNRSFIQREVTEWIQYQISNNISPFTTSFVYDDYKCERDTGLVVDAVIHDITHGGNVKCRGAANAYVGELLDSPGTYAKLSSEKEEDVAAFNYMLTIVDNILNNEAPLVNYQTLNGDNSTSVVDQYIDADLTSENVMSEITGLVEIITDAITAGNGDNIPERIAPNTIVNVKTGSYTEILPIIVPAECCIIGDETRSTTVSPEESVVNLSDTKYSIGALSRLGSVVGSIITGTTVTPTSGNTVSQSQDFPFADSEEVLDATRLVRTIQNKIDFKLGTLHLESSALPTGYNSSFLSGYGDAKRLLKENKNFIKEEITKWIAENYPNLKYSKTACRRDVGYIVDAVCYDLTYGGSHQTLIAGLAYFDGNASSSLMIDSSEVAATSAAYSRLKTVMQQIIANTAVTKSAGNAATQWTDSTNLTGGSSANAQVGSLVDIIINIIAGDSTRSTTPQINVTTIASTQTFTSTGHTLAVGDAVIPRISANGLVAGRKYWVSAIASNTFDLAASYGGATITTFTNGTGLDIDLETIDYPTATNGVTSTTALITAAQTLDAAQETIAQNVIDDLNAVAWHTDFVVDDTSLTSTDFRVYVGKHTLAHTYVSGGIVTKANGTELAITGFIYNESTGYAVVTTATHGLAAGDIVNIENITVSCLSSGGTAYNAMFPSATKTDGVTPKIRYIQNKCIRDVRLITEAVMFDFMFNSNFQTIKAAYSYLRSSAAEVFTGDQKTITRDAFANAKTEALANVGGNVTAQSRIETLMTLLDDIVFGATNEGSRCATEVRNADHAVLQLERNREFIVAEIDAWINLTYTTTITSSSASTGEFTCSDTSWMQTNTAIRFVGTVFGGVSTDTTYYIQNVVSSTKFKISIARDSNVVFTPTTASGSMSGILHYNSELCLRDVGTYIDALKYDIKYPGNYQSLLAARYYSNAVIGSLEEDMYYLRNGTGIRNMTLSGLTGDLTAENEYGTRRVTAGAYCSLDPGWGPDDYRAWIINRSPYIQNNATFGYAAVGQKIDGSLHNGGNKSIVSNDFTQLISDGIGAWVTNNGRAELVSVFSYYSHIGYLAENGGKIRATNGNNSYGDFGSVAEGVDILEVPSTAVVDNRSQFEAEARVFTDGTSVQTVEYLNAGTDYSYASMAFSGNTGTDASVVVEDFRDDAVFQVRLLQEVETGDGQFGGSGYMNKANTAQGGSTSQITIAATDGEVSSAYIGMKIILDGGTAVGQYAIIDTYNAGSKVATVVKESDGTSGWDHVVPGTTIVSPDASTTYIIEPALSFSHPGYSTSSVTLPSSSIWTDIVYADLSGVYLAQSATGGDGSGATFNIIRNGTSYTVTLVSGGTNYESTNELTIAGTSVGGSSTTNDITIIVTAVNSINGAIQAFEVSGYARGGNFIAISTTSAAGYSLDGSTWSSLTMPSAGSGTWKALAVGRIGDGSTLAEPTVIVVAIANGSNAAAYSTNGTSFTGTTLPSSTTWVDVAFGEEQFVAISASGATAYSVDGITWYSGSSLPSTGYTSIAYGRGVWVAVKGGSSITESAYSTDGTTWVSKTIPSSDWTSVTFGNGRFVAVSSGGPTDIPYTNSGTTNWNVSGTNFDGDAGTVTIVIGAGASVSFIARLAALGNGSSFNIIDSVIGATGITLSSNWNTTPAAGTTITASTVIAGGVTASSITTISFSGGRSSSTVSAYSLNGETWVSSTLPASASWSSINYGQGVFLAISNPPLPAGGTQFATSEDGLVWTSRSAGASANWISSAFGNPNKSGRWIAIDNAISSNIARKVLTGAKAKARVGVASERIFEIRITDPGSGYSTVPTLTITDPNNIYDAPYVVRTGKGAVAQPTFINRGTGFSAASVIVYGNGYADYYQSGQYVAVKRLTKRPVAGSNVVFADQPDTVYKLVNVTSFLGSYEGAYTAFLQLSPQMSVTNAPEHETGVETRLQYSQCRLTGHDFLNIGTGNFANTNYPGLPITDPIQANETVESGGGRVFFTSTDQDGNFRVGDLFTIEQSTGVATLNADAFNIAGLQELTLGTVSLGGNSAAITEFSTDPFFTADSDNIVPTQRAIKAYISAQIGGGGASINVNSVTAGTIFISSNVITTTTGSAITIGTTIEFTGGVTGLPVAFNYFLN